MKTDRLRRELARLNSVQAPELLPEIAKRIELAPALEPRPGGPGPRTRIGRVSLVLGVVVGVIAGSLVLTRVLPTGRVDREGGTAGPIPENGIVLGVVDGGTTRLYVAEEGGGGFTEVTTSGLPVAIPGRSVSVSPDGSRAAFIRVGPDERGMWISPIDGSEAVRLTEATPNGDEGPVWSPDGNIIAFSRNRTGHNELFTIRADGSNLTQITSNEVGQDLRPAWSPDGSSIVFVRNSGGPIDLWIVGADGTGERKLTDFDTQTIGAPSYPDWSSEGDRVAFAAAPPGAEPGGFGSPRDLWVIDADGTNLLRLTDTSQDEIEPRWSPEGSSIVFLSGESRDSTEIDSQGRYSPVILDLVTGQTTALPAPPVTLIEVSLQWLHPSVAAPDGSASIDPDTEIDWSSLAELPPPRRSEYRSEFVSDQDGYRFWPRSGPAEVSVAYRFDTGHCGLSFMTDFDGSFWEPVDPSGGEPPDFFHNQDVGAIALVSADTAIYRSSAGKEVALLRIHGPVTTHLCA
jgi:Tol biopolymer transport system component